MCLCLFVNINFKDILKGAKERKENSNYFLVEDRFYPRGRLGSPTSSQIFYTILKKSGEFC